MEVVWHAWFTERADGAIHVGCRRLGPGEVTDYSFGPGSRELLRRKVQEFAEACEEFQTPPRWVRVAWAEDARLQSPVMVCESAASG